MMVVNGNAVGKGDWGTELVANIDNLYVSVYIYIYIYMLVEIKRYGGCAN